MFSQQHHDFRHPHEFPFEKQADAGRRLDPISLILTSLTSRKTRVSCNPGRCRGVWQWKLVVVVDLWSGQERIFDAAYLVSVLPLFGLRWETKSLDPPLRVEIRMRYKTQHKFSFPRCLSATLITQACTHNISQYAGSYNVTRKHSLETADKIGIRRLPIT